MFKPFRAAAMAAAALGLLVSATFAAPVEASKVGALPTASYMDHASAEIQAGESDTLQAEASVAAQTRQQSLGEHAIAAIASAMAGFLDSALPRPRSLYELVDAYQGTETASPEQECLAGAVYFEARGEPIEGQLAVAQVVLNRAASGKYPPRICDVVTQPWQFSFIRNGRFPRIDKTSAAWKKAVAVAHIANAQLAAEINSDVLWYHADYVSPSWGKRLKRETKIGLHIFYS